MLPTVRFARATALPLVLIIGACATPASDDPHTGGAGGSVSAGKGGSAASAGSGGAGGSNVGGSGGATGETAGTGGDTAGTGGSSSASPDAAPDSAATGSDIDATISGADGAPVGAPGGEGPIPGCAKCVPLFDGKTLDGWEQDPAGSFAVKEGVIASTGKGAHAWTKDDYGDFRIFLSVRQIKGNHKPCTTLFNTRPPNGKAARGLNGIQFQPPMGGSWDYRPGKNTGPNMTNWIYPNPRPMFDVSKWHRCEILARASTGEFRAACCQIEGLSTCKAVEVLHYKDATAGKKGPFALMMHNAGLFDEYKDLYVETDPVGDELISTK